MIYDDDNSGLPSILSFLIIIDKSCPFIFTWCYACHPCPSLFSPQTESAVTSNNPSVAVPPKSNDVFSWFEQQTARCRLVNGTSSDDPKQLRAVKPTHPVHNLSSASNHPGGHAVVGSRTDGPGWRGWWRTTRYVVFSSQRSLATPKLIYF